MLVISTYFGHFDVDKRADRWPIPAMFTSYVSISFPRVEEYYDNLMVLVPSKPALQATGPCAVPGEGAKNNFFGEEWTIKFETIKIAKSRTDVF